MLRFADDETRVHLKKGNGSKDSDYINASYIHVNMLRVFMYILVDII